MAIDALDVLYVPSRDVEADVRFYRDTLGGRVVFAIEATGTRVAEIALAQGPRLLPRRSPVRRCAGTPAPSVRPRSDAGRVSYARAAARSAR